jgi:hypothetical protein
MGAACRAGGRVPIGNDPQGTRIRPYVIHLTAADAMPLQGAPMLTMTVTRDMTSDRTQAYGRVVKTLEDIGPAKLQPAELERIREAADELIFAADLDEARHALADVEALAAHLSSSGRWTAERAEDLVRDLEACGPVTPVA